MFSFRLVILDYAKKHLNDPRVHQVFSDLVKDRQINFERSTESHVYIDKHDLIGTHYLVYDTTDLFHPRIVAGIRTTYASRCQNHGIKIPLEDNILNSTPEALELYKRFKTRMGDLVECNGWFIDSEYSPSKISVNMPDVLFFALTTYLLRQGYDHFVGAPNERFKAARHVARVGHFEDGHFLTNPSFPGAHKLTLVHPFSKTWQKECSLRYGQFLEQRIELKPAEMNIKSLDEIGDAVPGLKKAA
jgi:hypothetical protein